MLRTALGLRFLALQHPDSKANECFRNRKARAFVSDSLDDMFNEWCEANGKKGSFTDWLEWILAHQEEILAFIAAIMAFFA